MASLAAPKNKKKPRPSFKAPPPPPSSLVQEDESVGEMMTNMTFPHEVQNPLPGMRKKTSRPSVVTAPTEEDKNDEEKTDAGGAAATVTAQGGGGSGEVHRTGGMGSITVEASVDYTMLAERSEGYSGADIRLVVKEAPKIPPRTDACVNRRRPGRRSCVGCDKPVCGLGIQPSYGSYEVKRDWNGIFLFLSHQVVH